MFYVIIMIFGSLYLLGILYVNIRDINESIILNILSMIEVISKLMMGCIILYYLLNKKENTPILIIKYYYYSMLALAIPMIILTIIMTILSYISQINMLGMTAVLILQLLSPLVSSLAFGVIWILYFKKSKRVKHNYNINNKPEKLKFINKITLTYLIITTLTFLLIPLSGAETFLKLQQSTDYEKLEIINESYNTLECNTTNSQKNLCKKLEQKIITLKNKINNNSNTIT